MAWSLSPSNRIGQIKAGGPELLSVVSRNNILHVRQSGGYSIRDASKQPTHDYDYDLVSGKVVSAGKQETHGVVGVPVPAGVPLAHAASIIAPMTNASAVTTLRM